MEVISLRDEMESLLEALQNEDLQWALIDMVGLPTVPMYEHSESVLNKETGKLETVKEMRPRKGTVGWEAGQPKLVYISVGMRDQTMVGPEKEVVAGHYFTRSFVNPMRNNRYTQQRVWVDEGKRTRLNAEGAEIERKLTTLSKSEFGVLVKLFYAWNKAESQWELQVVPQALKRLWKATVTKGHFAANAEGVSEWIPQQITHALTSMDVKTITQEELFERQGVLEAMEEPYGDTLEGTYEYEGDDEDLTDEDIDAYADSLNPAEEQPTISTLDVMGTYARQEAKATLGFRKTLTNEEMEHIASAHDLTVDDITTHIYHAKNGTFHLKDGFKSRVILEEGRFVIKSQRDIDFVLAAL